MQSDSVEKIEVTVFEKTKKEAFVYTAWLPTLPRPGQRIVGHTHIYEILEVERDSFEDVPLVFVKCVGPADAEKETATPIQPPLEDDGKKKVEGLLIDDTGKQIDSPIVLFETLPRAGERIGDYEVLKVESPKSGEPSWIYVRRVGPANPSELSPKPATGDDTDKKPEDKKLPNSAISPPIILADERINKWLELALEYFKERERDEQRCGDLLLGNGIKTKLIGNYLDQAQAELKKANRDRKLRGEKRVPFVPLLRAKFGEKFRKCYKALRIYRNWQRIEPHYEKALAKKEVLTEDEMLRILAGKELKKPLSKDQLKHREVLNEAKRIFEEEWPVFSSEAIDNLYANEWDWHDEFQAGIVRVMRVLKWEVDDRTKDNETCPKN